MLKNIINRYFGKQIYRLDTKGKDKESLHHLREVDNNNYSRIFFYFNVLVLFVIATVTLIVLYSWLTDTKLNCEIYTLFSTSWTYTLTRATK